MKAASIVIFMAIFVFPVVLSAQRIPINANLTPSQMYDKAIEMFNHGNKEKGLGYLKQAAGKHNIPALKFLGQCYLDGKYVLQDKQEAGKLFEIAAKYGDSQSAEIVAKLTESGDYTPAVKESDNSINQVVQVINHYYVKESSQQEDESINNDDDGQETDVDVNIPINDTTNINMFAVIISNENYQEETNVEYAIRDGQTFAEYCNKTLGVPHENIHFRKDATYNNIRSELSWLSQVADAYKGNAKVIFYYAGHGFPDEDSRTSYLLPVDGRGNIIGSGYSLSAVYNQLGSLPVEKVFVFLDACFSGAQRGERMLTSARGISIKAKMSIPKGKMIVFAAAKDDETAYPYKEKRHGLFTYYLLKKLQLSNGTCNLGELSDYIYSNVTKKSIVINGKSQTPTVLPSTGERETWRSISLK